MTLGFGLSSFAADEPGVHLDPADTEDRLLPTGEVAVRIYRPKVRRTACPWSCISMEAGGCLGSKNTRPLLRDVVSTTGVAVVFVSYTPSPEARRHIARAVLRGYEVCRRARAGTAIGQRSSCGDGRQRRRKPYSGH